MNPRVAIIGTAPSWQMVPWQDTDLQCWSLNDAYQLKGFVRAYRWYDFHGLDKFFHPPAGQALYAHQIPPGHYVRPEGHRAWLAQQKIPTFLHPDYVQQYPEAATWAHAQPFPKAQIEAAFGRYFTSSPSWMLAHAVLDGVQDISIYGIHLATQQEYIDQRPGFEYLIGRVLGRTTLVITVKDGMRHYTTQDGHIALPEASPVLQAPFQYAFDVRPSSLSDPITWELHKVQVKQQRLAKALQSRPWWQPFAVVEEPLVDGSTVTVRQRCSTVHAQLAQLAAEQTDWQHALQRHQVQTQALTCQ